MKRSARLLVRLVVGLVLAWALTVPLVAADYYLKGDCANNGNGTAAGCAASAGAAGAWNSVTNLNSGWGAVCAAGDTIYIRAKDDASETQATDNSDDARQHGGLRVQCSGTSGNPVTITNYPGEIARLANGPVGCDSTTCDNSTLSTAERNYVRIGCTDGLYGTNGRLVVRGMIAAFGSTVSSRAAGIVICGVEATGGWDDGGNWAPVRLENLDAPWVHHNYLHDVVYYTYVGTCDTITFTTCNASSGTAIKMYTAVDAIVEYNTMQRICVLANCGGSGLFASQAGGIDDKADSVRNTHRYNYIEDVNVGLRFQNQSGGGPFSTSTGTVAYGNVIVRVGSVADAASHGAIVLEQGSITDLLLHHNTVSGFGIGMVAKGDPAAGAITLRDSLFNISNDTPLLNLYDEDTGPFTVGDFSTSTNNNAYDSDADYRIDGNSTTIAAWRAASSRDANSLEASTPCGGFVSGSDTNFHISGTACDNESSTGGEIGAYGVTSCVGHLCGAAAGQGPKQTPPRVGPLPRLREE